MSSSSRVEPPSSETRQTTLERGIALALHLWSDLTFAVENNLGGGDSNSKRDWFAGAVAELFPSISEAPAQSTSAPPSNDDLLMDVEMRLLQIMDDEFDTIVDDGSAFEVAEQILVLWKECSRGVFTEVDNLQRRWEAGTGKKVSGLFKEGQQEDQDTDWDTDDDSEDDEEENGDVEMGEAPPLVSAAKKAPPVVDEDGFTTVTRSKR